jgi:predicted O-methyltransferase YrrM
MNQSLFSLHDSLGRWYQPLQLTCGTVLNRARRAKTLHSVVRILGQLKPDEYSHYLQAYLMEGLEKFGEDWEYLDITNTLLAASELTRPKTYLEIGVRRGRSMAMVAAGQPSVNIFGFDMWQRDYAKMENPGPEFVISQLKGIGHIGTLRLITGDSHTTVPAFLKAQPNLEFDLITVDGDHSVRGARADLETVLPRLAVGGILVFDDVAHPAHPNLLKVWRKVIASSPFPIQSAEFTGLGYGVAIGIRAS